MDARIVVTYKPYEGKNGLLGFVTLELETVLGSLWITDLQFRKGQYGDFVTFPSKKLKEPKENPKTGKMEEYKNIVFGNKKLTGWITEEVVRLRGEIFSSKFPDDIPF